MKLSYMSVTAIVLTIGVVCTAKAVTVQPDPALTYYLSPSGPLSVGAMRWLQQQQAIQQKPLSNHTSNTYTYLRCFYATPANLAWPTSAYVWGIDPSSGDYYRVSGSWRRGQALSWQNMFYSDVPQAALKSVCRYTLAQKGIHPEAIMFMAANNALSFNYAIWSHDNAGQDVKINRIVAFGDSLSDNQNMYNASLWQLPNSRSWYRGRFSNGRNWVEYVSDNLNLPLYNWAVGGAEIRSRGNIIPGIVEQVQSWGYYMQNAQNYLPENTLFTVLIGANDLINNSSSVEQIIRGKTHALSKLIRAGARNILVLMLPDVSRAPVFTIRARSNTIRDKVLDLNSRLIDLTNTLKIQYGPRLAIHLFDTYSLFNDLLDNPSKYNIVNSAMSCLRIDTDSAANYLRFSKPRAICANPDTFVFWDTLHPTTRMLRIFAGAVTHFVQENFDNVSVHRLE